MTTPDTLSTAIRIATEAHAGQVDKAGRPYIEHPLRVMERLAPDDIEGRIVAVLHDVLEDAPHVALRVLRSGEIPTHLISSLHSITRNPGERLVDYVYRVWSYPIARRVQRADVADNMDESRLALLDETTANRLRNKYNRVIAAFDALDALEGL